MIARDVRDAGKHRLVAAGESRHEMRLDEPDDDPAVGLDVVAVHAAPAAPSMPVPACASRSRRTRCDPRSRQPLATTSPTMAPISAGVVARCEPVPITMVTWSGGTCRSSVRIHGSSRSLGSGRVTSAMTIATRSCAATLAASGAAPERRADGVEKRRFLVGEPGHETRRENRHLALRERHLDAGGPILQFYAHDIAGLRPSEGLGSPRSPKLYYERSCPS